MKRSLIAAGTAIVTSSAAWARAPDIQITPAGSSPTTLAAAQNFVGHVAVDMKAAGDVVWIEAGVKHWHGATQTTGMRHLAIAYLKDGKSTGWLELVSDEQYNAR